MRWNKIDLSLIKTKNGIRNLLSMIMSSLAFGFLVSPTTLASLSMVMIFHLVIGCLLGVILTKKNQTVLPEKKLVFPIAIFLIFLARFFYHRWIPSGIVSRVASKVALTDKIFLVLTVAMVAVISSLYLNTIIKIFLDLIKKLDQVHSDDHGILAVFALLNVSFLEYFQLLFSALSGSADMYGARLGVLFLNVTMIMWINGLILLIIRNIKITMILSSTIVILYSLINHYTVLFHGSPFYFSELKNVGTAMNVLNNYRIHLSLNIIYLIILWLMEIYIVATVLSNSSKLSLKRVLVHIGVLGVSWLLITVGLLHMIKVKQKESAWMPWYDSINKFGYMVCYMEDIIKKDNLIKEPLDYNKDSFKELLFNDNETSETMSKKARSSKPDIIMILNESFCDLGVISSVNSDVDALKNYYGIDGATYGYAIVPNEGGGTNNSEFELLMSKSMYLMNRPAPFTYLTKKILSRSIISYLQNIGYDTVAMHCAVGENYSRNTAYPAMGFDQILFLKDFKEINKFGNRIILDDDNYKDMNKVYESLDPTSPHFIYLLTYQNHGGYEQNPDNYDTVHVKDDLGDLTDDVNEYLSSVNLSAEAFHNLTEYYSQVDRDVIICMVGDHASSFISELQVRDDLKISDVTINRRTVPYVIWSNFGAEVSSYKDYVSMVDLAPMVLQTAGLPLSPFYRGILDLHERLPIRTSDGKYVEREGTVGIYNPESEYYDDLNRYYNMEYNSLLEDDEYLEDLFKP